MNQRERTLGKTIHTSEGFRFVTYVILLNSPIIGKYDDDYDFKDVNFTDGDSFTAGC
jgi:hypothetical protein